MNTDEQVNALLGIQTPQPSQSTGVSTDDQVNALLGIGNNNQTSDSTDFSSSDVPIDTPTKGALLAGANPQDVQAAKSQLGSQQYDGWCMSFVAQATGSSLPGNAIDNWNESQNKVQGTLEGIQPGDRIFFSANGSNGYLGHVGLYEGLGKFISATDNGVAEYSIPNWNKITGQVPLGYVPN